MKKLPFQTLLSGLLLLVVTISGSSSNTAEKAPETGSALTQNEVNKFIELHNKLRSEVKSGPVTWSAELAKNAQEWANHLVEIGCTYDHRPMEGKWARQYGENLGAASPGKNEIEEAFKTWEDEKSRYDGKPINMDNLMKSGHYTQAVWKDTKQIGCGKVTCAGRVIFVCNYDPPGNEFGEKPY